MSDRTLTQAPAADLALEQDLREIEVQLDKFDAASSDPGRDLVKLVLTLVELLRQLMERQAIRRMEGGSLTDAQIERMGVAFQKMEAAMDELKKHFGFSDEDLNLDLGPLGKLL